MGSSGWYLVSAACFVATVVTTRKAEACSCSSTNIVLSPPPGTPHPLALPLIYYTNYTNLLLSDEAGTTFELGVLREASGLGLCSGQYRFVVPEPPLTAGGEYTLAPDPEGGEGAEWVSAHTVRFRAGGEGPATISTHLTLDALLTVHEPYESSGAGCGDRRLEGRVLSRTASVHLTMSAPTLLFVSAVVDDPVAGPLIETSHSMTYEEEQATLAGVSLPVPDEASACLDVRVFDVAGADVYREVLCLEPDVPVFRGAEVAALALESSDEEFEPTRGARVYTSGCGCRTSKGTSPGAWFFAGLLGVGLIVLRRYGPVSLNS